MVRTAASVALTALLAATPVGALAGPSVDTRQPHQVCSALLESADFGNRFEALRVAVKLLACDLGGHVSEPDMRVRVQPRLKVYARNCFDPQEQRYLREVLKSGALQELPHVAPEPCRQAFSRIDAMRIPPGSEPLPIH